MPTPHVLLIEDEPDAAEVLARYLQRDGLRVSAATTGHEGLKLAHADPPDLLLLDLILPDQDGMEVFRRFRGREPTTAALLRHTGLAA